MVPDGTATSDVPLERTIGAAAVIDLRDVAPNEAIDASRLASRAAHLGAGDIALFQTAWGRQRDITTPAFWKDAPWLARDGAQWLLERGIKAAAFDFPQDHTIRLLLDGEVRPIEEHVSHDVLLRRA